MALKKEIENKFNKGSYKNWKHGSFELLSDEIWKETKVRISSKTLKRYFGKDKTSKGYTPQAETLNALLSYAGVEKITISRNSSYKIYIVAAILFCCIAVLIFFIGNNNNEQQIKVELIKVEGATPTTAYFRYEVPKEGDSLFLSFGDRKEPMYLSPDDSLISHIYGYPDRFEVFVTNNKEALSDTIIVICKTEGWEAICFDNHERLKSYPIPIHEACDSGFYKPSLELLKSCGIDINRSFLSGMYNYSDFNVSGNNVTVEMKIHGTTFWPEVVCKGFALWVKCENGVIKQHFNAPGCSYWLNCIYGDVEVSGKKQDISIFSVDFSKWRTVKIESKGQIISIYVDGEIIHEQKHDLDFGNVVGVSCNFTANGAIDYYHLFDGQGNPVIMEDFDCAVN